jgi:hypothetical protein
MRSTARPSSASASSPSKIGASTAASTAAHHAADHGTPVNPALSSISSLVDKTRAVKSNLFPSHNIASNEPATAVAAPALADTFRSNTQASPVHRPHEQDRAHRQAETLQQIMPNTPPRDQQQPLQLQQLLQKLLRQVDDAERQRLVRV